MATNIKRKSSEMIRTVTAPTGGVASGGVIVRVSGNSGCIAVAVDAIATVASGPCYIFGVTVTLAALTGTAFTDGQKLYWDSSNSRLTNATTGNTYAGRASGAKASATATCDIDLNLP